MTRTLTLKSLDVPQTLQQFQKHGIGFDNLWMTLLRHTEHDHQPNYPFYNIIKVSDDLFYIEMAIAGFGEDEVSVNVEDRTLMIDGTKSEYDSSYEYVHRGLSSRSFQREFTLADHVEVTVAEVKNGILKIHLERRVPEEKKRKSIKLNYLK
jgi:molecular chaperone IbpA